MMYLLVRIFLLMGPLLANPSRDGRLTRDRLAKGQVVDTVFCKGSPDQSYALYLPANYSAEKTWPVVFIFEPGARGKLAVDIFKHAGEQFGSIIICSNNSSNEILLSECYRAAEAMFEDAFLRYQVDTSRLFVAGFSGGARVASSLALEDPGIKGVIACGAGMYHNRNTHTRIRENLRYYGIIGQRDMNLQDMIDTENRLAGSGTLSHFQYTGIGHVWPPPEEITAALAWLMVQVDNTDINARDFFLDYQAREIRSLEDQGHILDAAERLESVIAFSPDPELKSHLAGLQDSRMFKKQSRQRERAFRKGINLRNIYMNALAEFVCSTPLKPDTIHTDRWWTREIRILKRWENSENIESSRLASRLLYLMEAHFEEYIREFLKVKQRDKALFLADLWLKISPDQLWSLWNAAIVFTATGEKKNALVTIEKMVRSGKAEYEWFRDENGFESLSGEPGYMRLMKLLREQDNQ